MSEFSFTNFINSAGGGNSNYNSRGYSRPATENQKDFYFSLCERKRVKPKEITKFSFDELNKELQKLQEMPEKPSTGQIDTIKNTIKEIIELGGDVKPMSDEEIDKLEGGRNGTASTLIQTLFDIRQKLNEVAPPTDAQLERMVEWFLCPDIPYEQFNIKKKVDVEVEGKEKMWRYVTPNEFAQQIKENMTQREANRFIDQNRGKFLEWTRTRITKKQINHIRTLEERLADTYVPPQVEFAVEDGVITQRTKPSSKTVYNPTAYEKMDEMQLVQMSKEDAINWIDILQADIDRKNNYQAMDGQEDTPEIQQDFETKFNDHDERNRVISAYDAKVEEYNKFIDLIFAVESMTAVQSEEIHNMANELLLEDINAEDKENHKMRLREFFLSTVTADKKKDVVRWAKEMSRLYSMCEDVQTALDILPTMEEIEAS